MVSCAHAHPAPPDSCPAAGCINTSVKQQPSKGNHHAPLFGRCSLLRPNYALADGLSFLLTKSHHRSYYTHPIGAHTSSLLRATPGIPVGCFPTTPGSYRIPMGRSPATSPRPAAQTVSSKATSSHFFRLSKMQCRLPPHYVAARSRYSQCRRS